MEKLVQLVCGYLKRFKHGDSTKKLLNKESPTMPRLASLVHSSYVISSALGSFWCRRCGCLLAKAWTWKIWRSRSSPFPLVMSEDYSSVSCNLSNDECLNILTSGYDTVELHDSGTTKLQILCDTWNSFDTSRIGAFFFCLYYQKQQRVDETLDDIKGSHVHDLTKAELWVVCRVATRGPGTRYVSCSAYPVTG